METAAWTKAIEGPGFTDVCLLMDHMQAPALDLQDGRVLPVQLN